MARECFEPKKFRPDSLAMIETANSILASYSAQGYKMTLRQLYYQFVARDLIENKKQSYKRLGSIVNDGRMAGLIDWDSIHDTGRDTSYWLIEESTQRIMDKGPSRFAMDMWARQDRYVEVWVEKAALAGVVERACNKFRVPYLACKGYLSASTVYEAGKRFEHQTWIHDGRPPLVIHLGDHDPSGIDMSRDNKERASQIAGVEIDLRRIALNHDQVEQYNPPPNPTKFTDSRAEGYIAEHGYSSWELDALEPSVIVDLITENIEPEIYQDFWDEDLAVEQEHKKLLQHLADRWEGISDELGGPEDRGTA